MVGFLLCLSACNSWWNNKDDEHNPFEGLSAQQLYTDAKKEMAKNYSNEINKVLRSVTYFAFEILGNPTDCKCRPEEEADAVGICAEIHVTYCACGIKLERDQEECCAREKCNR